MYKKNKGGLVRQPVASKEENDLSKFGLDDNFSINDLFSTFQSHLYRSDLTKNELNRALAQVLKDAPRSLNPMKERVENLIQELSLIKITGIRYRKAEEIDKAMKYFYQICSTLDLPISYILRKKGDTVSLYLGCFIRGEKKEQKSSLEHSFNNILSGLLPGCTYDVVSGDEKKQLLNSYQHSDSRRILLGVPTKLTKTPSPQEGQTPNSQVQTNWGIERVLDAVHGDFSIVGYSKGLSLEDVTDIRSLFASIADTFHLLSKSNIQNSENQSQSHTSGSSRSSGSSRTDNMARKISKSVPNLWKRTIPVQFHKKLKFMSKPDLTDTPTSTYSQTTNENFSTNESDTQTMGSSQSVTVEQISSLMKAGIELIKRYDKRFEKSTSRGLWQHTTQVVSDSYETSMQVSNMLSSYWAGEDETVSKITSLPIDDDLTTGNKGLPIVDLGGNEVTVKPSLLGSFFEGISSLLTSDELAIVAGLPNQEVPGIVVEKLTDYGRNYPQDSTTCKIELANLVDRERVTKQKVSLDLSQIQRHAFVTGATGSGKSTTMKALLMDFQQKNIPFLVIEPIKREYRELQKEIPDLEVITLGSPSCRKSLNPFQFEKSVGLIPHIDNLKAAFNATMGNYSSMPFILEDILYSAYETCGWDMATGENIRQSNLWDKYAKAGLPVSPVPKMEHLKELVKPAIVKFFPNASDYGNSLLGALNARIGSMTRGAKGTLLNSIGNTIDMKTLLSKPCVIELWPFTDNEEKAFVMALLLIKLYEYRQSLDIEGGSNVKRDLEHVLVIEEAHRLLSKQPGATEHSSNGKQKAVEFFADILAEIRSYGQGIIIVDQIPSKMVTDVLKNTDVKIAHRLVDKEDRDLIGACMNLTDEQIKDLSRLSPGEAITYYGGLRQALKVKIQYSENGK